MPQARRTITLLRPAPETADKRVPLTELLGKVTPWRNVWPSQNGHTAKRQSRSVSLPRPPA